MLTECCWVVLIVLINTAMLCHLWRNIHRSIGGSEGVIFHWLTQSVGTWALITYL